MLDQLLKKAEETGNLTIDEITCLLDIENQADLEQLYACAYRVKTRYVGRTVWFRGIVEFSNICQKNCYYCGIRRSNQNVERFAIPENEIVESAIWSWKARYGSAVLQSGERTDSAFIEMIERVVKEIKRQTNGELGLTLCLGEQSEETYQRWFEAGAHRYLLRIETSNRELYQKIHPPDHSYEQRLACLDLLRKTGYQVGTGVMIGLPMQNTRDLASDILFMKRQDIDMIGMGPYIYHENTPLINYRPAWEIPTDKLFNLGLKMIALARIVMRDINIAATTALQALDENGREKGLLAGANVIMPNTTDTQYRGGYKLYENKPCTDENAVTSRDNLTRRIEKIGEEVGYDQWGDSPHFFARCPNSVASI